MTHLFVRGLCVVAVCLLACACEKTDGGSAGAGGTTTAPSAGGGGKKTIAAIPKGTTHVFWKTVEAGARKAADETGVNLVWKGPIKEDDRAEQIKVVEQFVSEGVSGICLAPLDTEALARPVGSAMGRKIPVVIFDSSLKGTPGTDYVSYVATDNRKGGQMRSEERRVGKGGRC